MKRRATLFLQAVIVALGIVVLVLLLWEPHLEGRNAHATLYQIYFNDPFLACAYTASILFFAALYQAFKLLGYVRQNRIFSQAAVQAVRTIKYCAMTLVVLIASAESYLFIVQRDKEDIAGGVAMGLGMIFVFLLSAAAAAMFERRLQSAMKIKSENDPTV